MNSMSRIALLAGVVLIAACQQRDASTSPVTEATFPSASTEAMAAPSPAVAASPLPAPSTASAAPGANPSKADPYAGTNDGYPPLSAGPIAPDAAKTEKGARAVLLPWARGIELREFDQSWSMMGDAAKAQVSKSAFTAMFAPYHDLMVALPSGTMEGAAGSSYYTVPTTVTGIDRSGKHRKWSGDVVMRRVNDVPGATPAQLAWHIEQVNLKPA
jgi:hypothetical protein